MASRLLLNRKPQGGWALPVALSLFILVILISGLGRQLAWYRALALCDQHDDPLAAIEAGDCREARNELVRVDKLYPSFPELAKSSVRQFIYADGEDRLAPLQSPMALATSATLSRFLPGVALAMGFALVLAMLAAASGYTYSSISSFGLALSYVPAIALTPFFFSFPGSWFHISIVAFGLGPVLLRDLILFLDGLPDTQRIKAQTIHASTLSYILRVLVPQTIPRLLDATRVAMGLGWILVIAAEFVIAREGIGLRIWKLKRRYDVDNLLPIVLWVTLLAIAVDVTLRLIKYYGYPWTRGTRA